MDKIGNLVNKRLNQHHLGESARASAVVHRANSLITQKLNDAEEDVRAFRLKDGVLWINTTSAVWSQEVWGIQENLKDDIQKEFGKTVVSRIVIKTI